MRVIETGKNIIRIYFYREFNGSEYMMINKTFFDPNNTANLPGVKYFTNYTTQQNTTEFY